MISLVLFILYGLAVVKPLFGCPRIPRSRATAEHSLQHQIPQFYDAAGWTMGYAVIGQIFCSKTSTTAGRSSIWLAIAGKSSAKKPPSTF
ncbi:MAG: hypothetical protein U0528_11085 [Anaerolineae bacterium]